MKFRFLSASVAVALLALAIACGGSPTSATQSGSLSIMLKDSPFSDARAVLVTFSEISVHSSGGGWTTLAFSGGATSRTCDLKQLTSAQDVLGTGSLPAGHYTQVRVTVTSAVLHFDNPATTGPCAATIATPAGRSASIDIPPAQIVLNREFDLPVNATTSILLDFDGDKSIIQTGNGTYKMSPVISIVTVH
jgi:hypothetical protein